MWTAERYVAALDFAARAHGQQKLPGSDLPYVVHLAKVAQEVMRAAVDDPSFDAELAVTCALLHDCIEDAGVTREAIAASFGDEVADGVAALTKDDRVPKEQRMLDSLTRIRGRPRAVWAVKLADRITNLEPPPPHWSSDKRRSYLEEARLIRETLRGGCAALEARLEQRIARYARDFAS